MDFKNGRRYRLTKDVKNSRHDRRYKSGAARRGRLGIAGWYSIVRSGRSVLLSVTSAVTVRIRWTCAILILLISRRP